MPIVAPLALLLGLVLLGLVYYGYKLAHALVDGLAGHVPLIGGALRRAGDAIVNAIVGLWAELMHPHMAPLVQWFRGIAATVIHDSPVLRGFAKAVVDTFDVLRHTKLPAVVHALLDPVATVAHEAKTAAAGVEHDLVKAENAIDVRIENVVDYVKRTAIPTLERDIEKLNHEVFAVALPRLEHEISREVGAVAAEIPGLTHGIDVVGKDVASLERLIEEHWTWLAAFAGSFALAEAVGALRRVITCRDNLDRLCRVPGADLESLLALVLGVAAFPSLTEFVRFAQHAVGELEPVIRDVVRR